MKFRGAFWNTLWLVLVFIALLLYLVFVEVPSEKKKDEEFFRSKEVLHFKVEEVEEFDLTNSSGMIKVRRNPTNTRWEIKEPLAVSGDNGVINQLLLVLEEARISRMVDEEPKSLADFGLEKPTITITLRFKSGDPKTVLIGNTSPLGHSSYIKLADEKRVLLSPLNQTQFALSVNDLRSKLLLDFVPRDVTRVTLHFDGKIQSFTKEGEHWKLTAPVQARGDTDEILNFLNAIRMERIENFIAETQEKSASAGLAAPRIVLTIHADKANRSWTLKIGKPHDEHSHYAQRGSDETLFTVSESLIETLSKNPLSFMEKSLITFNEEDVVEIESRDGGQVVQVVRDSTKTGMWKYKEPTGDSVDSATVNTLILDLKEARIQEFAPVSDLKLFGLDKPQKSLTVYKQDASKETLQLGNPDRDQQFYFATRSSDHTVFKLDAATAGKLFRSQDDFKDKKLLKFDPEQVARIQLQYPDQTFELKKENKQWRLIQPVQLEVIKPFAGKDILWILNNLEYETRMNLKDATEVTGLQAPHLTISLHDKQNTLLGKLKIGKAVNQKPLRYTILEGDDSMLYLIKERTLSEIPDSLNHFKKKES